MAIENINFNGINHQIGGSGGGSGVNLPYNLVVLGDSIAVELSGKWFNHFVDKYPIKNAYNLAVGGAKWAHQENATSSSNIVTNQVTNLISKVESSGSDHIPEPDIVLIHCGTNDVSNADGTPSTVFGWTVQDTLAKSIDNVDLQTICGGMRYAIELLRNKFPYVRIVLSTPLYTSTISAQSRIRQLNALIKDCASYISAPVIDLTYESGITSPHGGEFLRDGLHPNVRGGRILADVIGHKLITLFGFEPLYDYHSYTISGVVKTKDNGAVSSAQTILLFLKGGYTNDDIVTEADGTFSKELPAGEYIFKQSGTYAVLGTLNVDEDKSGIVLNLKS